jgi:hypothetical protein
MAKQFHAPFPKDPPLSFHHKSCKVVTFSQKRKKKKKLMCENYLTNALMLSLQGG